MTRTPNGQGWQIWAICGAVSLLFLGCTSAEADKPVAAQPESSPADAPAAVVKLDDSPIVEDRPGTDWPIFLGLLGTGVSSETNLLETWPKEGPPVVWEKQIGKGYSAPSILGDRLVVHHRLRDEDIVECLDRRTGQSLWKTSYSTDFSDPYGYNNGPRCSPLLIDNRCYTFGAQGKLLCVKLDTGETIWERDTAKDWKVPGHFFGAGCTPILEDGKLIVLVGGQPESAVVAFDPLTGKTLWESVGRSTWEGVITDNPGKKPYEWTGDEMLVSYSTPFAATIHGQRHLLCLLRQGLVSLDPTDGRVRFKYWFRSRTHESVNAARPVVVDDLVLLSAAYDTGAALLRILPDGNSFEEVWRNRRGLSTHWSTPIVVGDHVFGFSGRHENEATLQCLELKSGDLVWETNGFEGDLSDLKQDQFTGEIRSKSTNAAVPWPFYGRGSKILADGKFIVLGERGTLALVEPSTTAFREISRTSYKNLKYPIWPAPVLSHGLLYLRSEDWLVCLDIAEPADVEAK